MKRLVLVVAISFALTSAVRADEKFHPVDAQAPFGHYIVRLSSDLTADAAAELARQLAQTYGGRLELFATTDFRGFAIVMPPARARLLSDDARVISVDEEANAAARPPSAAPRPALPRAQLGVATNSTLRIAAEGAGSWSSGPYAYDAAGNITAIGADTYVYDSVGRLVSGTAETTNKQTYSYDAFGNRLSAVTTGVGCVGGNPCGGIADPNPATNRLRDHNAQYDAAGNLIHYGSFQYAYDGAGMVSSITAPDNSSYEYVYTVDDERLATAASSGTWDFTIRDAGNKVIREVTAYVTSGGTTWTWGRDHVFRSGALLASITTTGTQQFHLDHLSTPRLVTNAAGGRAGYHAYYPFGQELDLQSAEAPEERLKFTGHERDPQGSGALDYMHARFYGATLGRFLSVDPKLGEAKAPQSWNRYTYVQNNPALKLDPDGRIEKVACDGNGNCMNVSTERGDQAVRQGQLAAQTAKESVSVSAVANVKLGSAGAVTLRATLDAGGQVTATAAAAVAKKEIGGSVTVVGTTKSDGKTGHSGTGDTIALSIGIVSITTDGTVRIGPSEEISKAAKAGITFNVNPMKYFDSVARSINTYLNNTDAMRQYDFALNGTVDLDHYLITGGPP